MSDQYFNGSPPFGVTPIPINIMKSKNGNQTNINTTMDAIYTTKCWQINFTTVIYVVGIDMYYGKGILGHWCVRFLVITTLSGFHYFLDECITTILISDSLNSVQEDKNTRFKFTFILKPKHAFDLLRENMLANGITILEHDDLCFSATSNNEPHLHVFRFKQDDEFVSDEKVSRELGPNYISLCL